MRAAGLALLALLAACTGAGKSGVGRPDWMDEGAVQIHAISDRGRPLVGGGLLRRVTPGGYAGFRAFVPVLESGSYTGDLFWRSYFRPERPSSLFVEGDASLHLVKGGTTFVPSASVALGVRTAVTDNLSVGGSFGPLIFPSGSTPDVDHLRLGPFGVAPRMLASVDFHL